MAQKIGIFAHLIAHPCGVSMPRFDPRSTAKVEETRAPGNGKPFRSKVGKQNARREAFKATSGKFKGTYVSYEPRTTRDMLKG